MCPQSLASKHGQFVRAFCRGLLAVASRSCRHLSWKPVPLHQMTLLAARGWSKFHGFSLMMIVSCPFPQGRDVSHFFTQSPDYFFKKCIFQKFVCVHSACPAVLSKRPEKSISLWRSVKPHVWQLSLLYYWFSLLTSTKHLCLNFEKVE